MRHLTIMLGVTLSLAGCGRILGFQDITMLDADADAEAAVFTDDLMPLPDGGLFADGAVREFLDASADAGPCPPGCECLSGKRCQFRCTTAFPCRGTLACPRGWSCNVVCTGFEACTGGLVIDLRASGPAARNLVTCSTSSSCRDVRIEAAGSGRLCLSCLSESTNPNSPGCDRITGSAPAACVAGCGATGSYCRELGPFASCAQEEMCGQ